MKRWIFGMLVVGLWLSWGCAKESGKEACLPEAEVCDGIDNDCNGEIDEGGVCLNPRLEILVQPAGQVKGRVDIFDLRARYLKPDALITGIIPNQMLRDGDYLYILNSSDASLQKVDIKTMKTDRWYYLPQGSNPWSMAVYQGKKAFISAWLTHQVILLDLETGEEKVIDLPDPEPGKRPYPLGVTLSGSNAFVAESAVDDPFGWPASYKTKGAYAVIDANNETLIETKDSGVDQCINIQQVVKDESGRIFIVCAGDFGSTQSGRIIVKDSSENVVGDILIGNAPTKIYFNSGKGYLTDMLGPNILVIDTQALTALRDSTNPVVLKDSGYTTTSLGFTPDGRIYATIWDNTNNTNLIALDPLTFEVQERIDISGPGQDIVYIE